MGSSMSRSRQGRNSEQAGSDGTNAQQQSRARPPQAGYPGSMYPGSQHPGSVFHPGYPGGHQGPMMHAPMHQQQMYMNRPNPMMMRGPMQPGQMFFPEGGHPGAYMWGGQQQPVAQMQRTCTIRNDVNLKKKTITVTKDTENESLYHIEFAFDASADCAITMHYAAKELPATDGPSCSYQPLIEGTSHPEVRFKKGLGQTFKPNPEFAIDISKYSVDDLVYKPDSTSYPLIVVLEALQEEAASSSTPEGAEAKPAAKSSVHSQTTFATFNVASDGSYGVKVLKQKIQVGNTSYELQEIFGIEQSQQNADDTGDDMGKECVICMTEPRDTTVLPCRHMCMCSDCAKVLRFQTDKCPICRQRVESLLQIKAS